MALTVRRTCFVTPLFFSGLCPQILRWNWSRAALALSFARSAAPMAFALRFSVLPLIDTIAQFAFGRGVESHPSFSDEPILFEQELVIECSAIDLQRFTRSKYFESELHRSHRTHSRVRKSPAT